MTILETTRQIIQKHKLEEKLNFNPFKLGRSGETADLYKKQEWFQKSENLERELFKKWRDKIPPLWYGFDLIGCPENWLAAIDEFLTELEKDSSEFEIHTIKLKWGGVRIYLCNESSNAQECIDLLEDVMQDSNLVY